jgi:prepilin-type N-terminal cleavage/methylation domain-containing protein
LKKTPKLRSAFTLFELMIVVVIIGVIYSLILSNFHTKKQVKILKIEDIKEALLPLWSKGKRIDFYLYDSCQKSAIFLNEVYQETKEIEIPLKRFQSIELYKPDMRGEAQKVTFTPIMIDNKLHKVCFKYSIFPNGSNSSYLLKKDNKFYIFYPYFQDVNTTDELSEAIDLLQHKAYRGVRPDAIHE